MGFGQIVLGMFIMLFVIGYYLGWWTSAYIYLNSVYTFASGIAGVFSTLSH